LRIPIRTSRWAIWARRFASLAVPLTVIPVLLHRFGLVTSDTFEVLALAALIVILVTLVSAIVALARLWQSGDEGWGRAIAALFIGLLFVVPFLWAGYMIERYPLSTDVATTGRETLPLVFDAVTERMPPGIVMEEATLADNFPNATSRVYPLTVPQAFALIEALIAGRGWEVVSRREPDGLGDDGQINARITQLLGWRDEVVLKTSPDVGGVRVDMRSVSLDAIHDFGANGLRIEEFMTALDTEVTTLLRDNPNITEPIEADPETAPVVEGGDEPAEPQGVSG
jgi:hypothetical protein